LSYLTNPINTEGDSQYYRKADVVIMVRPTLRSGKRKYRKTVSGKITIYRPTKVAGHPKCAECKAVLHGTAKGVRNQVKKMKRSERTPSRVFGGNLCSSCTRRRIIATTRS